MYADACDEEEHTRKDNQHGIKNAHDSLSSCFLDTCWVVTTVMHSMIIAIQLSDKIAGGSSLANVWHETGHAIRHTTSNTHAAMRRILGIIVVLLVEHRVQV